MWGDSSVTAASFLEQVAALNGQPFTVRINSGGGSVTEGMTIADAIRKARANVHIVGQAASIASFIAMHGERVTAAPSAWLMIHNAWQHTAGDGEALRKQADALDKVSEAIAQAYVTKTGLPLARIKELMDAETYLTAQEALAAGFIDAIVDGAVATTRDSFGSLAPAALVEQALATAINARNDTGLFSRKAQAEAAYLASRQPVTNQVTVNDEQLKARVSELEKGLKEAEARAAAAETRATAAEAELNKRENEAVAQANALAEKEMRGTPELRKQILDSSAKPAEKVALLNGLSGPSKGVPKMLQGYIEGGKSDDRAAWSFKDWSNKDPRGLEEMRQHRPDEYKALFTAYRNR